MIGLINKKQLNKYLTIFESNEQSYNKHNICKQYNCTKLVKNIFKYIQRFIIKMNNDIPHQNKVNLIKAFLDKEENKHYVNNIFKKYINITSPVKKENQPTKKKCNNTDTKYIIILKLINTILTNIGKPNINKLEDFKMVDREDIIKEANERSLTAMEDEIYKHFDKAECGWYRRKMTKAYILTFLRYACDKIGYKFTYSQKELTTEINNRNLRQTHIFYNII